MTASPRFVQRAVNLGAAGALLWFAAPLRRFGSWHPFDGPRARVALLALAALLLVGLRGLRRWLARRRNEQLLKGLESGDATVELSQRFREALALLRQGVGAQGAHRWWQRRRQVQQLPWYLIIGAPGGGKTTAIWHSGLRFPLAEKLGRDPLAGYRRNAPVRLVVQRGRRVHRHGWTLHDAGQRRRGRRRGNGSSSCALLRRHRPVQPINGVIVSVSVPDLLQGARNSRASPQPSHRDWRNCAASSISPFRSTCW